MPARAVGTKASDEGFFADRVLAAAGLCIGLSVVVTLPAMVIDTRTFQGNSIWLKPLKFQVALTIYLLTLSFYARWLPRSMRESWRYRDFVWVVAACAIAEMLWVGSAAMAGVASHYNQSSIPMKVLYPVMGVIAIILTSSSFVFGIAINRNKETDLEPPLRLAIALGLILTFALTVPAAAILSAAPGHGVGVPPGAARVPVLEWARQGGDLRVAHFFATHALHVLPLFGLAVSRVSREANAVRWVVGAAVAYATLVAFTLAQALMGRSFLP